MLAVDIALIAVLIVALVVGVRVGLFASAGVLAGLLTAAAVSPWVLPFVAGYVPEGSWRATVVVAAAVALIAGGATLGGAIGRLFRKGADKIRLRFLERLLGGVLAVVVSAISLSLIGTAVVASGSSVLSPAAASSQVLRTIDRIIPDPVIDTASQLYAATFGDTVLPAIDGLLTAPPAIPAPESADIDTDNPALAEAANSVARVSGRAFGCNVQSTGSGFVAENNLVVTNAHVVAGVEAPLVELPGQPAQDGRIVYFDPVDDLAVISAPVSAPALELTDALQPGDAAALMGYPGGGRLQTVAASVVDVGTLQLPNVYGTSQAPRSVFTLGATIKPGNSGGPLLTEQGDVAGVVFARDLTRSDVGYAMTTDEVAPVLDRLYPASPAVSSGECVGD